MLLLFAKFAHLILGSLRKPVILLMISQLNHKIQIARDHKQDQCGKAGTEVEDNVTID